MMDINDFKMINDTYGHAEGDEFVMIAHPEESHEIEVLIETIRNFVAAKCMQRADEKLYTDKENCKKNGKSTICK